MAKIPVRFKRVAAAFDELARARLCESSGSEHSAENSADLSDLIDSFMETDGRVEGEQDEEDELVKEKSNSGNGWSDSETKEMLRSLLGCDESRGEDDDVKRTIRAEMEGIIGTRSSDGLKRQLMTRLRERGLDAGLCKSRWEKTGRFPAGDYEYIDVIAGGTRYIVEIALAGEFTIARPTDRYLSLLEIFPSTFVGKPDELKQVVRLMCAAARESMKTMDMHVPPWRRNGYMQAKWFNSYRRTTSAVPAIKTPVSGEDLAGKRSVGFEATPAVYNYCRGESARKLGLKAAGNLAAACNGIGL